MDNGHPSCCQVEAPVVNLLFLCAFLFPTMNFSGKIRSALCVMKGAAMITKNAHLPGQNSNVNCQSLIRTRYRSVGRGGYPWLIYCLCVLAQPRRKIRVALWNRKVRQTVKNPAFRRAKQEVRQLLIDKAYLHAHF